MPRLFDNYGVKLAAVKTSSAFDAFVLKNFVELFFSALNGFHRTHQTATPTAVAFLVVHPEGDQRFTDLGRTFLLGNVGLVFIPEVFDGGEDRIGGGLPQAAQGRLLDRF